MTFHYWYGSEVNAAPAYVDQNADGRVTIVDFLAIAANFSRQVRYDAPAARPPAASLHLRH